MVDFLSQFDHFPCSRKDGLISLLLPKLNVKRTIREPTLHQSCFPRRIFRKAHFTPFDSQLQQYQDIRMKAPDCIFRLDRQRLFLSRPSLALD
jgi:hypothetical protein